VAYPLQFSNVDTQYRFSHARSTPDEEKLFVVIRKKNDSFDSRRHSHVCKSVVVLFLKIGKIAPIFEFHVGADLAGQIIGGHRMEIKKILVPIDFSHYAEYAYQWALSLAERCHAEIILFHATPPMVHLTFPESVYFSDLERVEREMLADTEKRLQEFANKKGTSAAQVSTRATLGEPTWEICQMAEREQADLIIMGSHGRTGLSHVLLGSVAERVVRHATCPVLVARQPDPEKK
jgi:nucleotide-binding universal stress UspA family protein